MQKIKCTACNKDKSEDCFSWYTRPNGKVALRTQCEKCRNASKRKWWADISPEYREKRRKQQRLAKLKQAVEKIYSRA